MLSVLDRFARWWLDIRLQPRERKIFSRRFRWYLWCRDNGRCQYCGKAVHPERGWHIEHILPFSFGGPDTEDNLVVACIRCNLRKGTKIVLPQGYYQKRPLFWRLFLKLAFRTWRGH